MVYLITNSVNGKRYIGYTTKTLEERLAKHKYNAAVGIDTYLYRAMRKHGPDKFSIQFLADGVGEMEAQLIEQHKPEYNMTPGGDGGDTSKSPRYQAWLARRPSSAGENNPMYGRRGEDSPNYGKKRTEKQKENHRKGYKGKRVAVRVDGIEYESVARAAKILGRSERYIRLHDEINEWSY